MTINNILSNSSQPVMITPPNHVMSESGKAAITINNVLSTFSQPVVIKPPNQHKTNYKLLASGQTHYNQSVAFPLEVMDRSQRRVMQYSNE